MSLIEKKGRTSRVFSFYFIFFSSNFRFLLSHFLVSLPIKYKKKGNIFFFLFRSIFKVFSIFTEKKILATSKYDLENFFYWKILRRWHFKLTQRFFNFPDKIINRNYTGVNFINRVLFRVHIETLAKNYNPNTNQTPNSGFIPFFSP